MTENTEMALRLGYAWREKAANEILAQWHALPWYKRAYWTLRGKKPADHATLVKNLS